MQRQAEVAASARRLQVCYAGEMKKDSISIEQHSFGGLLWLAGWLFTVGFLHLPFWRALAALIIWPYLLGATAAG